MRVLITNTGPWGTGSGSLADSVTHELLARGHEVMAFFPDSGLPGPGFGRHYDNPELYRIVPFPATREDVHLDTFPLIIPDPNPRNHAGAWTFRQMSRTELAAYFDYILEELQRVLIEFEPDVIECQHIWAIDHLLDQLGQDYICVAHHSDQMGFRYDRRMREYACRSARRAAFIFAISEFVRDEVIELYGVDPNKVITIENGYDQSVFFPTSLDRRQVLKEVNVEDQEGLQIVTFCGKVSRTKGIDVLLEANPLIQREVPVLLLLAGSGTLDALECEPTTSGCLENAFLLGHRSPRQLARLHNIARLSVVPSRAEGFGIAALEAMACGKPLVASRVGGLSDLAVGELVEPDDPVALARSVIKILNMSEESYRSLSKEALAKSKRYSTSRVVDKRLTYYEEVATLKQDRSLGKRRLVA